MDGIPVKVNEKSKPPPKITLPACILNRLHNVQFTNYTYDFSLETTIVEHMSKMNKICNDAIEKHAAKTSPEISPDKPNYSSKNGCPSTESTILTPIPITSNNAVTTSHKENHFKYSDFENDTSSPFDNEELKTINDMEELAHVLGATSATSTEGHLEENCVPQLPVVGSNSPWSQLKYGSPSQSTFYTNHPYALPTSQPSHTCPVTYSSQMPIPPIPDSYQAANFHLSSTTNSMNSKNEPVPLTYNRDNRTTINEDTTNDVLVNGRAADAGVPEILKSLQNFLGQRKTYQIDNPHIRDTQNNTNKDVPNPSFFKLNEQEQTLAKSFAKMGFPLSRTTEAVKKFGLDETKILEYVLLIQSLVDKGYRESQTIHALEVNKLDKEQTVKYLDMLGQMMKVGFKEDEVVTALAKTQHDRDKAFDILLNLN